MSGIGLVKQIDETGCGIACVSMLSGESYSKVKSLLFKLEEEWGNRKSTFYTKAPQLLKLLDEYKIEAKLRSSGSWDDIQGCAIVGVNKEQNYFHWVIVIKNKAQFLIIDPETGEIYQAAQWIDKNDGYFHSKRKSDYISIERDITSIKI